MGWRITQIRFMCRFLHSCFTQRAKERQRRKGSQNAKVKSKNVRRDSVMELIADFEFNEDAKLIISDTGVFIFRRRLNMIGFIFQCLTS